MSEFGRSNGLPKRKAQFLVDTLKKKFHYTGCYRTGKKVWWHTQDFTDEHKEQISELNHRTAIRDTIEFKSVLGDFPVNALRIALYELFPDAVIHSRVGRKRYGNGYDLEAVWQGVRLVRAEIRNRWEELDSCTVKKWFDRDPEINFIVSSYVTRKAKEKFENEFIEHIVFYRQIVPRWYSDELRRNGYPYDNEFIIFDFHELVEYYKAKILSIPLLKMWHDICRKQIVWREKYDIR
ncbi:MAG: hypothetical protein ACTSSI_11730 [Candidatus Helarchaeota archaeon]